MIEQFLQRIRDTVSPDTVRVALDVGAGDCAQAIELAAAFPDAHVYSFECNPRLLERCRAAVQDHERITLVELCVFDEDGEIEFHPNDPEKTVTTWADGNQFAASVFRVNGAYDHIEKYVQETVVVPCTRLDTWASGAGVEEVDVVWMDLQGAELHALRGLGDLLASVRAIHTETELKPMYHGQDLYEDLDGFLREQGFWFTHMDPWSEFGVDVEYVRR